MPLLELKAPVNRNKRRGRVGKKTRGSVLRDFANQNHVIVDLSRGPNELTVVNPQESYRNTLNLKEKTLPQEGYATGRIAHFNFEPATKRNILTRLKDSVSRSRLTSKLEKRFGTKLDRLITQFKDKAGTRSVDVHTVMENSFEASVDGKRLHVVPIAQIEGFLTRKVGKAKTSLILKNLKAIQ